MNNEWLAQHGNDSFHPETDQNKMCDAAIIVDALSKCSSPRDMGIQSLKSLTIEFC